ATSLLAQAPGLFADGLSADAVALLNKVVRMDLPANREADKLLIEAYKTLGDIYRTEAGGLKAARFYSLAVQRMSPELDAAARAATLTTIAELQAAAPVRQ